MAKVEEMKKTEGENQEIVEIKEKKPNVFKRCWTGIKTGIRKVRESPVAAAIGMVIGAGVTLGAKAYLDHRAAGYSGLLDEETGIEEEPEAYEEDAPAEEVEEE